MITSLHIGHVKAIVLGEKASNIHRKTYIFCTFWSLQCSRCGLYRRARDAWTPTEDRWEQMTFSVNTATHVTVSVKNVSSDSTVSGYTDECRRNCKILSRVFSLSACLNNQQRCYFAHPDNNAIKSHFFPLACRSFLKWK